MKEMKVKVTFTEEVLGTANNNPDVHKEFIASKGPDAKTMEEEVAAIGVDAYEGKTTTVFPKEGGKPFLWDYQWKGLFKDACGMLRKVSGSKSSGCRAYKKEIDGLIFVKERKIPLHLSGELTECTRPLRAQTAQGERVALSTSEAAPAGTWVEFTVQCLVDADMEMVREWLDYGALRGFGQWRNSGKGRYTWEEIS